MKYKYNETGTFKSRENAAAVVNPVITEVSALTKELGMPVFPWSLENLTGWMMREERGSKTFSVTTLWPNQSVEQVVTTWYRSIRRKDLPANISHISGGARLYWEVEDEYLKKAGPIGGFLPSSIDMPRKIEDLLDASEIAEGCNREALRKAVETIKNAIPAHSIHALPLHVGMFGNGGNVLGLDGTTNGCWPVVVSGWGRKEGANPEKQREREFARDFIYKQASRVISEAQRANSIEDIRLSIVGILGIRVNEPKGPNPLEDEKYCRPVIACPKWSDTAPGSTLLPVLEEAIKSIYWPETGLPLMLAHLDGAHVDKGVETLLQIADKKDLTVLSIDYSHYDRSVAPELRRMVDDAIMEWMDKPSALLFKKIEEENISGTKIVTPYRLYNAGAHGVNSGSIFTNFIDSMVNWCVLLYGHYAGYYDLISCHPQGDDNIAIGYGLNPESIAKAGDDLGFELNAEKQLYEKHMATFLKRYYFQGRYGGIYPTTRACTKAKVSEDDIGKFVNDASFQWQQTYKAVAKAGNVVYSPFFKEYVDYCKRGDPLHLGADYPPSYVSRMAGDYAKKYEMEVRIKPYIRSGEGMSWDNSFVNGVIRGESVPTTSDALFQRVTGHRFQDITFDNLKYPIRLANA